MIRIIFFSLIFLIGCFCNAQAITDSLQQKTYDELLDLYNTERKAKISYTYAHAYLIKSKKEKDTSKLLTGYHLKALLYRKEKRIQYYDSINYLTKFKKDKIYPSTIYSSQVYSSQGDDFYEKRDFKTALDYYFKAKKSAEENDSPNLIFISNCGIGMVLDRTNDSIGALKIHKENYQYAVKATKKGLHNVFYLSSLYALANAYNNVKVLDSAAYYNRIGLEESVNSDDKGQQYLFLLNDGTTQYYLKNYGAAIKSLTKVGKYFKDDNDAPNFAESLYYLGRSQYSINEKEKAIANLKRIDSIFSKKNDLLPRLRGTYPLLIDYYKEKQDLNKQLYYLNQLIKLDSIITSNEIYLGKAMLEKHDIPKIIAEKEAVIIALESDNTNKHIIIIATISVLLLILGLLYNQYLKKKKYKTRYEAILEKNYKSKEGIPVKTNHEQELKKEINIPEGIVQGILKSLNKFETRKGYLAPNITIQELAKVFKTNASYLSKVVNHYKKQNFTTYINYLRIDYVINELLENKMYRKFTIKALATEVGFKSAESFSKAFYKKTGIKPSYFIAELEKNK